MKDKPVILLIEDDKDSAKDYKDDTEEIIPVTVIPLTPPINLLELTTLVTEHQADAVVLDELLQQRSDATYVGIDAYNYLHSAFPTLPIEILTEYPPGPELRGFPTENLIRKHDFSKQEYKVHHLQELYQRIQEYRQKQAEIEGQVAIVRVSIPIDTTEVSEDFVRALAKLHFELEDSLEQIVWVKSKSNKEICLIEVNRTALPVESLGVFRFAPSEEVPFPLLIVDVRPKEWEQIQQGEIPLPEGWDMKTMQIFQRSEII